MSEQAATGPSASAELLAGLRALGEQLAFNRHLDVGVEELEVGRCVTRLPANDRLANHVGSVHAIAELAPVELAGAMAASSRLAVLLEQGLVPVVGRLEVRYAAPARGDLLATAEVGEQAVAAALSDLEQRRRPRVEVEVQVTDAAGTVVAVAQVRFVFIDTSAPD